MVSPLGVGGAKRVELNSPAVHGTRKQTQLQTQSQTLLLFEIVFEVEVFAGNFSHLNFASKT